jgi:hypothetical protein
MPQLFERIARMPLVSAPQDLTSTLSRDIAMKLLFKAAPFALLTFSAHAQGYVYEQPMTVGGGITRASQLWIDPTGQNDSDNDAIAWENFELPVDATITKVRWWGQPAPPLGFEISFFHQDPNTIAVQPDIFAPGSQPISEEIYTTFTQTSAGGGMVRYELDLVAPLQFAANTRYFISVVGRTPFYSAEWRWAQSPAGLYGTFWWQRGAHMFFHLGDNRAVALATAAGWPVGTSYCSANPNSTGTAASITALGSVSAAANALTLSASALPLHAFGFFMTSRTQDFIANPAGSQGNLCLGGASGRFVGPGQVQSSGAAGRFSLALDLTQQPTPTGPTIVVAGETWSFQAWYRDSLGGQATSNFTNGVVITFS